MFGEEKFNHFEEWFSTQERGIFPKDFLYFDGNSFHWLYMYEAGLDVPSEFEIIDFPGGLYAAATDIDQQADMDAMNMEVDRFLRENGFERDKTRPQLGNVITSPAAQAAMGYEQMNYYFPIKIKNT